MTGSHLDSVGNGGNFDGAAGVIAGLVAIKGLQRLGLRPHCDVTTAAIRAEESVWFQVSYIGSRSAFGVLPAGALEAKRVDTGRTLAEHMAECGADIDAVRAGKASLEARSIRAWVELHIEQAPQLVEAGLPVAVGHRSSGQLSLSAGEDRGRIRARRPAQAVSARRGACGQRVRDRPRRDLEEERRIRPAHGIHHRPLPHRPEGARADQGGGRVDAEPGRARLRQGASRRARGRRVGPRKGYRTRARRAVRARSAHVRRRGAVASRRVRQIDGLRQDARHPDDAARKSGLARHRHLHGRRRAVRHAVRAQRQRQPQSARGHGDRRLSAGGRRADALSLSPKRHRKPPDRRSAAREKGRAPWPSCRARRDALSSAAASSAARSPIIWRSSAGRTSCCSRRSG